MIHFDAGKRLRVLDVVPVEEEDSRYTGFLRVVPGLMMGRSDPRLGTASRRVAVCAAS
jgi:hypothetical protein